MFTFMPDDALEWNIASLLFGCNETYKCFDTEMLDSTLHVMTKMQFLRPRMKFRILLKLLPDTALLDKR